MALKLIPRQQKAKTAISQLTFIERCYIFYLKVDILIFQKSYW